jgi:hypothetical protein
MSIFKANKKWLSIAETAMSNAETIAEKQKDINFGRELLANIRQYRIEQAAVDQAEASIGTTQVSGVQNARQFLQRQLNEPYSRTLQDAERQEQIEAYQNKAQEALDRFKKQAKTAKTTGYITAIAAGALGAFLAPAALAAAGVTVSGAAGTAAALAGGALVGGTLATAGGRALGADRNYMGGAIQGTTTATIAAGTIGYGAGAAGTTSGITEVASMSANTQTGAVVGSAAEVTAQGWSASHVFAAANTVFSRLGNDMKYLSQDPQLRVQLRGFA